MPVPATTPPRILIAFDGSAVAGTAMRAAASLFPGARATVLAVHEDAVGATTVYRAGGGFMSPEVVKQGIAELEQELVESARSAAADGARLGEAAGLVAEPAVVRADGPPLESDLGHG
jgi:hypothetical protein